MIRMVMRRSRLRWRRMTSRWSSSPSSVITPGWNLILLIFIRMMMMEEVDEEERRMAMWKMIIINLIATLRSRLS